MKTNLKAKVQWKQISKMSDLTNILQKIETRLRLLAPAENESEQILKTNKPKKKDREPPASNWTKIKWNTRVANNSARDQDWTTRESRKCGKMIGRFKQENGEL